MKLPENAQPLSEAPQKNYALFVDSNHILNVCWARSKLMATSIRCCFDGVTSTTIGTGYQAPAMSLANSPLGKGAYAVCGAQVGQRNLILSNEAAFVASFTNAGYTLQTVATGCGALATRGMAVVNARAYWASGVASTTTTASRWCPLECSIKTEFAGKISLYNENKIFAWRNVEYNEIWFHYPHHG